jgi:hypothetical protein
MDRETALAQIAFEIRPMFLTRQPNFTPVFAMNLGISPDNLPLRSEHTLTPRTPECVNTKPRNNHRKEVTLTVPGRRGWEV